MSILCKLGLHRWKPHYRQHSPEKRELILPWVPSLFSGPPFVMRTGVFYTSDRTFVHDRCNRCGKVRR